MGRLLPGSRPYHDLPNVPSLTSGGLGRLLGLIWPREGGYRYYIFREDDILGTLHD
ncbi:hypothetical protein QJS10_CPB17g00552 [Acorus calamus]|uniref:Uncharacterized protein n=1 Tax=Acorus calamus TaxID=4465 RepID=A0AAV9CUT2_ACOCL|nr:hypothetical protein QJS10_CPB17g00552 [Acorus calamus]